MRKITFLSLLLMAMAFVQTAQATKTITIYVKADNQPNIYYWGGATSSYPGEKLTATTNITPLSGGDAVTFYFKTFTIDDDGSVSFLFNYNGDTDKTSDITVASGNRYYHYKGNKEYEDITDQYSIEKVQLPGSYNNWKGDSNTLTGENPTYTGTIDVTGLEGEALTFKLLVNNSNWLGYTNLTIDAPDGWLQPAASDNNIQLNFKSIGATNYTITATWDGGSSAASNWTLKITANITIYVKADSNPNIHYWDYTGSTSTLPGETLTQTTTVTPLEGEGSETFYYKTFSDLTTNGKKVSFLFNNGGYNWTKNICNITKSSYYIYNADGTFTDVTATYRPVTNATISSVKLPYDYINWNGDANTLSLNNSTYTGTIDVSNLGGNSLLFKLQVNNDTWLGWKELTITAPEGLVEKKDDDGNIQLNYGSRNDKIYNFTATWGGGDTHHNNWTLNITGDATVKSVKLPGSYVGWDGDKAIMTSSDGHTYTYKLDLSETTDESVTLKLLVDGEHWLGYTDVTIDAPEDWVTAAEADNNIQLNIATAGTKIFYVTATWAGGTNTSTGWTLAIRNNVTGTIASSGWSSLACAYPLTFEGATNATGYVVTNITNTTVTLESVTTLPANTGVLLKGTGGKAYSIPVTASASAPETNYLKAAVKSKKILANEAYILKDGLFHLVNAASAVPAGKAYLLASDVPEATPARSLSFAFDDEGDTTTGVTVVRGETEAGHGEFFDMQGRRVATPTKGLYIINGKKVVVK